MNIEELESRLESCPDGISRTSNPLRDLCNDMLTALKDNKESAIGLGKIIAMQKEENARLRSVLQDVIRRISNSRKGSMGSIANVYICQIGVDEVVRWSQALENP